MLDNYHSCDSRAYRHILLKFSLQPCLVFSHQAQTVSTNHDSALGENTQVRRWFEFDFRKVIFRALLTVQNFSFSNLSQSPQYAPTSPSAPTFQDSSKEEK